MPPKDLPWAWRDRLSRLLHAGEENIEIGGDSCPRRCTKRHDGQRTPPPPRPPEYPPACYIRRRTFSTPPEAGPSSFWWTFRPKFGGRSHPTYGVPFVQQLAPRNHFLMRRNNFASASSRPCGGLSWCRPYPKGLPTTIIKGNGAFASADARSANPDERLTAGLALSGTAKRCAAGGQLPHLCVP